MQSVYVSNRTPPTFEEAVRDTAPDGVPIPKFEQIASIYARAMSILQPGPLQNQSPEFSKLLSRLGVKQFQTRSAENALAFFRCLPALKVAPQDEPHMGITMLLDPASGQKFVHKIGRVRASRELLAIRVAGLLGLEPMTVKGLFCVLRNQAGAAEWGSEIEETIADTSETDSEAAVSDSEEEEMLEELWNGLEKVYRGPPSHVVGIVENAVPDNAVRVTPSPLFSYSQMLIVALAIGLRDGKEDGFNKILHTLFDLDDCFPIAVDPAPFESPKHLQDTGVTATDLPLLNNTLALGPLSRPQVTALAEFANQWDIDAILEHLAREPIRYADAAAETLGRDAQGRDETGSRCTVKLGASHAINGRLRVDIAEQKQVLNADQIRAVATRLERLQEFLLVKDMTGQIFTPLDMVHAVDPFFQICMTELDPLEIHLRLSPRAWVGRHSLGKGLEELSFEQRTAVVERIFRESGSLSPPSMAGSPTLRRVSSLPTSSVSKLDVPLARSRSVTPSAAAMSASSSWEWPALKDE